MSNTCARRPPPHVASDRRTRAVGAAGSWALPDLFELIRAQTGQSILYSTRDHVESTKIELIGRHAVPRDRLFEWLQAVLSYHRFVLVPAGPKTGGTQQWFCLRTR